MNLCDIKTVRSLLNKYSTGTKKGFGQNFLINPEIPENIADESFSYHKTKEPQGTSCVLEIGPGIGTLTNELCSRYDKVVCVEIDKTLIPILDETLDGFDNVTVVNEDFLKLDLDTFLSEHFGSENISVCANLPYYITTPIIMKLLEGVRGRFVSLTVMVQKEVAERLCATEKDSDYGAITASINYYGKAVKLFDVAPENFMPAPNVVSSVIRIELYKEIPYKVKSEKMLFETIAGAFSQRRKTLLNSLSSYFSSIEKSKIAEIIESCGFEPTIRGERLSIENFCTLADKFYEIK